ncbi:hypothetical protein SME02_001759 [Klebsiella aerogenes]|nr:hypothetical protein [Klebsiella aerogenes]ELY3084762.1 hypothetical protein [Klebsiella aerogenes]
MPLRKLSLAVFLIAALGAASGHACESPLSECPDYFFLTNREARLLELPQGNFAFVSSHLLPPDPLLPQWRDTANDKLATSAQGVQLKAILESGSVEAAEKMTANLPAAERLYTLGAVAYDSDRELAREYFRQLLALPAERQGEWGLKALFALGQDLIQENPLASLSDLEALPDTRDIEGSRDESAEAFALFQQIIDAVRNGQDDPQLLSLASLGQQARIASESETDAFIDEAHFYARLAAQGSLSSSVRLYQVAENISHPENEVFLQKHIADPLIRQLLIAHLNATPVDASANDGIFQIGAYYPKVVEALLKATNDDLPSDVHLIALAYRYGQYSTVTQLLQHAEENMLTSWLRAKMALREGDVKKATVWYEKAASSLPVEGENWVNPFFNMAIEEYSYEIPSERISAERALLALKNNNYPQAMELMYRPTYYWRGPLWIGERLLTIEELTAFVDEHFPSSGSSQAQNPQRDKEDTYGIKFRTLLARRLMRDGQYQKALPYFDNQQDRQLAQSFVDTLPESGSKIDQAEGWWQAAVILREHGDNLMSYFLDPDQKYLSDANTYLSCADAINNISGVNSWVGSEEQYRIQQSGTKPFNHVEHYRWRAAKFAEKAASLLPRKSQAYAAILCNASSWVSSDQQSVKRLYQLYVKNGAPFPWAEKFGRQCPSPDFSERKVSGES